MSFPFSAHEHIDQLRTQAPNGGRKHSSLFTEISACQSTLSEIKGISEKSTPRPGRAFGNTAKRFLWPLKKTDVMPYFDRVERHKAAFDLALSAYGTYAPSRGVCQLTSIRYLLYRENKA